MARPTGIRTRHSRLCALQEGRRCNCNPTYEAFVYSRRDGKKLRRTFANQAEARAWRHDALVKLRKGAMRAQTTRTVREAADAWLTGAKDGSIRNRSGDIYKPSAIRTYEHALRQKLLPAIGAHKLADITPPDVQDFADRLVAEGMSASSVRNTLMPLRAIYKRAVARGQVAVNPTSGVELPAQRGSRDRIAAPGEAEKLIEAVSEKDRAIWATAMYAGLRRGELRALRWCDIDLKEGVIRVEHSWDGKEGFVSPKSKAGRRRVPIPAVLRKYLSAHKLRARWDGEGLAFGGTAKRPFEPSALHKRARDAWIKAELEDLTLHDARHTFASLMIAAGVNAKALATYMGHASVTITYDRYGHLMPGNEGEAAEMLDQYLAAASAAPSA